MKRERKKEGERSKEVLHHFRCGECSKWWSVGDAPAAKTEWHCPWCGAKGVYRKISSKLVK